MKIVYTDGLNPLPEKEKADLFMNAQYFQEVKAGAKSATVYGDYPNIVEAYEAVDIKVKVVKAQAGKSKEAEAKK